MTINNINGLCEYFGSENPDRLEHDIYRYTDCGAWIKWDDESVTIGSIVEGSDAEFDRRFYFPVESKDIDDWFDELEQLTDEAWHMANDKEEEPTLEEAEQLVRDDPDIYSIEDWEGTICEGISWKGKMLRNRITGEGTWIIDAEA